MAVLVYTKEEVDIMMAQLEKELTEFAISKAEEIARRFIQEYKAGQG